MRYRLMATYRGVAYEAGVGPTDKDIVLFAACPPPEELGFQPATGHWRKAVSRAEVDAVWESRPSGTFRGEPCLVLDDLGEHLHISYLGHHPSRAERLGYSQTEPGVFELLAVREDVTGITEDRVDHAFLPWQQGWPAVPAAPGAADHDWPESRAADHEWPEPRAAGPDWPESRAVGPDWPESRAVGPDWPERGAAGTYLEPAAATTYPGPGAGARYPGPAAATSHLERGAGARYPGPVASYLERGAGGSYLEPDAGPGAATGYLEPGVAARHPEPDVAAGYSKRDVAAGYFEPDNAAAYSERDAAAAYPEPDVAAGYPEPGTAANSEPGTAAYSEPGPEPGTAPYPEPGAAEPIAAAARADVTPERSPAAADGLLPQRGRRHGRSASGPQRAQTRQIFAELIDQAAIPQDAYAVDEAVDGAVCLVSTDTGFEVFSAADGIRQEVRLFPDEETAYFYVFGLLAAEAVREGRLVPPSR